MSKNQRGSVAGGCWQSYTISLEVSRGQFGFSVEIGYMDRAEMDCRGLGMIE